MERQQYKIAEFFPLFLFAESSVVTGRDDALPSSAVQVFKFLNQLHQRVKAPPPSSEPAKSGVAKQKKKSDIMAIRYLNVAIGIGILTSYGRLFRISILCPVLTPVLSIHSLGCCKAFGVCWCTSDAKGARALEEASPDEAVRILRGILMLHLLYCDWACQETNAKLPTAYLSAIKSTCTQTTSSKQKNAIMIVLRLMLF
ncbi:hypothetical protein MKW98_023487 [Papaver atlanticum]|uniref:Uncharacterized protein n=1 Tax=Papaver atlanticum TaxID=357466 RepID=A0AAD4SZ45_9MAGN|nr:hypothetical protein MKW98_023487 [Papaver atlanticum]